MSERELTQHFGTRVEAPFKPVSLTTLKSCVAGIQKQMFNERYPDRKKLLRSIKKDIQQLIKELS